MNAKNQKFFYLTIAQNKLAGGAKIVIPQVNSANPQQNKQLGDAAVLLAQGQTEPMVVVKKKTL